MKLLSFLMLFTAFLLTSCGNDPVTNNGNGTNGGSNWSQIYAIDSVSLRSVGNGNFALDTTFITNQLVDTLKIEFTSETNCNTDSVNTQPYIRMSTADSLTGYDFFEENRLSLMNGNFTVYMEAKNRLIFNVQLNFSLLTGTPKFLKLKNIKLYRSL